jgi:hypothetical protein
VRRIEQPISASYGFERGTPVDRPYIEAHLAAHAADVAGRVLEVKDDEYARRYGGTRVTHVDVVDVDAENPRATIVADLDQPGVLAADSYDCIILTQVLEFLRPERALPSCTARWRPAESCSSPCRSWVVWRHLRATGGARPRTVCRRC